MIWFILISVALVWFYLGYRLGVKIGYETAERLLEQEDINERPHPEDEDRGYDPD